MANRSKKSQSFTKPTGSHGGQAVAMRRANHRAADLVGKLDELTIEEFFSRAWYKVTIRR